MIYAIKNIKETVKNILVLHPETRDKDNLLILKVWKQQNPLLPTLAFDEFAVEFLKGNYANPESIRRSRQSLQGKYLSLRGDSYYKRKNQAEQTRLNISTI